MKEYCIYTQISSGRPFILDIFNNIDNAKIKLLNIVALEEERGRVYYVDNDFFENKYPFNHNGRYMSIQEREVSNWVRYDEKNLKYHNSNIIYANFSKNF